MPRNSGARRTMTTRYRAIDVPRQEIDRPCPGCREQLPPHATFCTQCGTCLLAGGTAVSRRPTKTQPNAAILPFPPPEEELDLADIDVVEEYELELELDDVEITSG